MEEYARTREIVPTRVAVRKNGLDITVVRIQGALGDHYTYNSHGLCIIIKLLNECSDNDRNLNIWIEVYRLCIDKCNDETTCMTI